MPEVYSYFNRPPAVPGPAGKSMTDGSFKDSCDVNSIVKRFTQTGLWPEVRNYGFFEDITGMPEDLMAAHELLRVAEREFMDLPSGIRERFGNNPMLLLQFLQDPANRAEGEELGLFRKAAPPTPAGEASAP